MMPKLPQKRILYTVMPDDYRYGHVTGYSKDDLIAFGRAVAESCAEKCEELGDEIERLRAECDALKALLIRCRPVIESEVALMESMARHMAGGFPPEDVASADQSADFHWVLLRDIDAALKEAK